MLGETIRELDRIVAAAQATGRVPSLVAAIVRDGAPAHFTGAGELPPPAPDTASYPPLRTYHYSNLAYGLLGAVAERIAGEPWSAQVAKRLLDPLGMTRTTYQATEPFARGYVVHPWHGTLREEPRHDAGAMAPAGQLWSTSADLVKWAAFLADPQPSIIAPATLAYMYAPVVISDLERWTA